MQNIGLNDQVIVNEISRVSAVGVNPSHLGCGQKNVFRPFHLKEVINVFLDFKVQFLMSPQDKIAVALRLDHPQDSRANQTSMSSDVDFGGLVHDKMGALGKVIFS